VTPEPETAPATPDQPGQPDQPDQPTGRLARVANALRRHPIRLASTLVVLGLAASAAAVPSWTARQIALSFNPKTSYYSELFFTNIGLLPVHATPGTHGSVHFSIVNREGHTLRYSYLVAVTIPGLPTRTELGHVTVKDNQKADVIAPFEVTAAHTTYTVTIRLNQPFDAIEFHGRTT
jgi:hypothetical protein